MKIVKIILVGIGATVAIDCFTFIVSLVGNTSRGILFLGRWLAYMPKGKFLHHSIVETPSITNELLIGQIAHYSIGITFAFLLVAIYGSKWLTKPKLFPALVIALISLILPIFILQPALGFGIAFSNRPEQGLLILKSLMIHLVYGFGLYQSAKTINGVRNTSFQRIKH
ncbi:MAG: DUF2938 family protein [Flavobacterium sp.]|nr:DUF2938 family protein [Flavobacterium sp.]